MRQLTDVVTDYVRPKRTTGTQWYTWSFRPDRVPPDVLDSRGLAGTNLAGTPHSSTGCMTPG